MLEGGASYSIFPAGLRTKIMLRTSTKTRAINTYVNTHVDKNSYRDYRGFSFVSCRAQLQQRRRRCCSVFRRHIQRVPSKQSPTMKFSAAIVTILSAASVASGFVATPRQCKSRAVFTSFVSCSMHPSFDACFFVCMLAIFLLRAASKFISFHVHLFHCVSWSIAITIAILSDDSIVGSFATNSSRLQQ